MKPVPHGQIYLGLGGTFKVPTLREVQTFWGYALRKDDPLDDWECGMWDGTSRTLHFCALHDSEIVKLNDAKESPAPAKEHIIWCSSRGDPTVKQPSLEAAEKEVKRLAAKHPGVTYHICEIVASYVGDVTIRKC
jgi:hypothetical protein